MDELLKNILNGVINAGVGYGTGALAESNMNPLLKSLLTGALGGGTGGGGTGSTAPMSGYHPGWEEQFGYEQAKWKAEKERQQGIMDPYQQQKLAGKTALYDKYRPQLAQAWDTTSQEQNIQGLGSQLQGWVGDMWSQDTPAYKERVDRTERERIAQTQQDMQDLIAQNTRAKARGGVGLLNPERQDEAIARTLARTQDTARDAAHKQVMGDLSTVLKGGGAMMDPLQKSASADRMRQQGGLAAQMGIDTAQLDAQLDPSAQNVALEQFWGQKDPSLYDIKSKYFWEMPPGGGSVSTGGMGGGTAGTGGTNNGTIQGALSGLLSKIFGLGGSSGTGGTGTGGTGTGAGGGLVSGLSGFIKDIFGGDRYDVATGGADPGDFDTVDNGTNDWMGGGSASTDYALDDMWGNFDTYDNYDYGTYDYGTDDLWGDFDWSF